MYSESIGQLVRYFGYSAPRLEALCRAGQLSGAAIVGKGWLIPMSPANVLTMDACAR